MPKLADTLVEGTIARWLKQPGDQLRKGEPFVEIETDKVNSELEAPIDGVLTEVLAKPGDTVDVGTVIARIGESSGLIQSAAPDVAVGTTAATAQQGLPLMRRRIAEHMQESRARIAQGACVREVELATDEASRDLSPTAAFVKALALVANVSNVGIAVEVADGLLVPVVRNANIRSLEEISAQVRDLASRARDGGLRPDEVAGAEFTVTNVGAVGTLMAFPLVPVGQPGILAVGAIRDGRCFLTLCYDRGAMNDYQADQLLARVAGELSKS
jgi:pyruvate/2-oxoglutarate dehydrogenase complex dihydrolipoamide acyltransferase (E2) component